jgi:pyruvate kinase
MIKNPRPSRAEMTDISNACLDGADAGIVHLQRISGVRAIQVADTVTPCSYAVMLSGETANGAFPAVAVATMHAITQNAEQIIDARRRFDFLRSQVPSPLESAEAVASSAVQMALDMDAQAIFCFTTSGRAAPLISKYRPPVPVFVVTEDESIIVGCRAQYSLHGVHMDFRDKEVCTTLLPVHTLSMPFILLSCRAQMIE